MPASAVKRTTPAPAKTFTPASVTKALDKAHSRVTDGFSDMDYAKVADLVCKLTIKYVKEELKLD